VAKDVDILSLNAGPWNPKGLKLMFPGEPEYNFYISFYYFQYLSILSKSYKPYKDVE
jgi:hypothetical protein